MKRFEFIALFFITIPLQGQIVHTKEIKDTTDYGLSVFNIITDNININYREDLEYNWYNQYSGQQSSMGASGGNLLHGRFSYFDKTGRLVSQGYYKFGLLDSTLIKWNDLGEIREKYIYKKGVQKYEWFKSEEYIFEVYSSQEKPDYKRFVYTLNNILISEEKCISAVPRIWETSIFNENNKKLLSHYYIEYKRCRSYGPFNEFFEEGSLKCSGNYDKKYMLGHKVGLWLVFNESTHQFDSIRYKLSERILNSDGDKEIGSLVYLPDKGMG